VFALTKGRPTWPTAIIFQPGDLLILDGAAVHAGVRHDSILPSLHLDLHVTNTKMPARDTRSNVAATKPVPSGFNPVPFGFNQNVLWNPTAPLHYIPAARALEVFRNSLPAHLIPGAAAGRVTRSERSARAMGVGRHTSDDRPVAKTVFQGMLPFIGRMRPSSDTEDVKGVFVAKVSETVGVGTFLRAGHEPQSIAVRDFGIHLHSRDARKRCGIFNHCKTYCILVLPVTESRDRSQGSDSYKPKKRFGFPKTTYPTLVMDPDSFAYKINSAKGKEPLGVFTCTLEFSGPEGRQEEIAWWTDTTKPPGFFYVRPSAAMTNSTEHQQYILDGYGSMFASPSSHPPLTAANVTKFCTCYATVRYPYTYV
jgi:hypothetical protein